MLVPFYNICKVESSLGDHVGKAKALLTELQPAGYKRSKLYVKKYILIWVLDSYLPMNICLNQKKSLIQYILLLSIAVKC